jgi:hypothetical protein
MRTFKNIIDTFQAACTAHKGVNTFYYGTLDKLDSTSQNVKYNYVFLRPLTSPGIVVNANGQSGIRRLSFELYSLDVPRLTESDYLTVMSDTEFVIYDLISYFNLGTQQQNSYIVINNITPVNEAFNDRVYGWVASIDYVEIGNLDFCLYPS